MNNHLTYSQCGDYFLPDLVLKETDCKPIGKWGRMHRDYLKEHRPVRNEDKLLATMTDEQKELFDRYTEAIREHQALVERLLFQSSFKLGARMMLEVMEE